jgi:hypothetical protein
MFEKFKEFRSTLAERIKSPFIGSFMISWVLIHWKIPIYLIYNEDSLPISGRVDKIQSYLNDQSLWTLAGYPIIITIVVLLVYNILNAIGLGIKLLYDNWAAPYMQKLFNNDNIIEKSKYDKLKRDYTIVKREYAEEKESYVSSEKELRELQGKHSQLQDNSYVGKRIYSLSDIFDHQYEWERVQILSDGRNVVEYLSPIQHGFMLDNRTIRINNAWASHDLDFVCFDIDLNSEITHCTLTRDNHGNYIGFERGFDLVRYRRRLLSFNILSAKYKFNNNYIDVKEIVQNIVNNNVTKFKVTNEIMKGDPAHTEIKTLEVTYRTKNGSEKTVSVKEHEEIKFE